MYYRQKGLIPLSTSFLGITIAVYSLLTSIVETFKNLQLSSTMVDIIASLVAACIVLAIPIWASLFLILMFPAIKIMEDGLKYSSLGIITGTIKWNEIENLRGFDNGFIAIGIRRKGFFLFNGLYFNKIYALLIGHESPVLFLSSKTENLKGIVNAIQNHSEAKTIKQRNALD
jgi:hypothetical protein